MAKPEPLRPSDASGDPEPAQALGAARAWHALTASEVLATLAAGESGLSESEAAARRRRFGPNELPRGAQPGLFGIYLRQFKNPLVYLLLGATAASLGVGEITDAAFIFDRFLGAVREQ